MDNEKCVKIPESIYKRLEFIFADDYPLDSSAPGYQQIKAFFEEKKAARKKRQEYRKEYAIAHKKSLEPEEDNESRYTYEAIEDKWD